MTVSCSLQRKHIKILLGKNRRGEKRTRIPIQYFVEFAQQDYSILVPWLVQSQLNPSSAPGVDDANGKACGSDLENHLSQIADNTEAPCARKQQAGGWRVG
ncbi:MAG: hypothetical protein CSA33_04375 [Desulfobulbus propionicus]|nr:MAG: hypothetical protein CSA33_04375 [Desulfobulbus propionicus]